jgi:uncharacterized protein YxjI
MQYLMRQRLFAFGDDFVIKDASGADRFVVDGRAFSLGDKLAFRDMAGTELAFIRQRLLALTPTYELSRNGQPFATIQKSMFTLFRAHFAIDVPGPDDLEAQGDFLDHEYSFTRSGAQVAQVSKRWFALGDTYGVDIADDADDVLILACTVVIDMVAQDAERRSDR